MIGQTGALNSALEISFSQNYKSHTVRLSKNQGKILKYTLKIPTNEFNFNKAAGKNINFSLDFWRMRNSKMPCVTALVGKHSREEVCTVFQCNF